MKGDWQGLLNQETLLPVVPLKTTICHVKATFKSLLIRKPEMGQEQSIEHKKQITHSGRHMKAQVYNDQFLKTD